MARTSRVVPLLLALSPLLAACGDGATEGGASTTASSVTVPGSTVPGSASTSTSGGAAPTTTTAAPAGEQVHVVVAGGAVTGGAPEVSVGIGETVTLLVEADVDDEVHVHGYDLLADVAPGAPASLTFTADIPGQFEVELEDAGLLIVDLTVS